MVKTWFIKVTGDLNCNFGSIMELLRDNWEIIQLQSIFPSPLQNILSIACRTLWSLLFTTPWEPQNRCPAEWVHCFYTHSIFHSPHPYQFSLQIYLHNITNTSQGGLEQDRKNNLRCLITLNLWSLCVQWLWVSQQWNATHQHDYLWLWEEAGYDGMRKGTGKEC